MQIQDNNRYRRRGITSLADIHAKKRNHEPISYKFYTNVILNECKQNNNYDHAEQAYCLLIEHVEEATRQRQELTDEAVGALQRAILVLTRYAPDPQKALDYTGYYLAQEPPFRTEHIKLKCINNLILKYKRHGTRDSMRKALELIKMCLDRTVPVTYFEGDKVAECFVTISYNVLKYYDLEFSSDRRRLVPSRG